MGGQRRVYNMTLPGGQPITQGALEHRSILRVRWSGEVAKWMWKHGFGFIRPDSSPPLPLEVQTKLAQMQKTALIKSGKGQSNLLVPSELMLYCRKEDCSLAGQPDRGLRVTFNLYLDDKGAG